MSQPIRVAVVIDLDWPLKRHYEVFSGIQNYAQSHAPDWVLIPDLFPAKWIKSSSRLPGYDAVIGRVSLNDARAAIAAKIPIVNVWRNSPATPLVPSVLADTGEAGRMAAEHLISRGLRRLAGVGMRRDLASVDYLNGFETAAKAHNVPVSRHYVSFNHTSSEKHWHRFVNDVNQWIDEWELPIGIASSYDELARYLTTMCIRRGRRIPEELAIIGNGDDPMHCEGSDPELSSIDMGRYREGYLAAELVDRLLKGGVPPTEPILTPPADLVARLSTDVYAVADKTVGRAMRFIAEHCGEPIRVADVAKHVGCERRKLEKQFRTFGRRSINEEIVALRIELTKRLLVSTDDPIEDVAFAAGYGTAQHMRHVFRHKLKTTPKAFREQHRK